jgi:hypothetical protein
VSRSNADAKGSFLDRYQRAEEEGLGHHASGRHLPRLDERVQPEGIVV